MKVFRLLRTLCLGIVIMYVGACSGGDKADATKSSAPAASDSAPAPASSTAAATESNSCPLTVEQVAAVTGAPMTDTGSCTFFPANGRDIPHVFYVRQTGMVCSSIKPSDLGFTEAVPGLSAREAYVRDQLDGSHVLVCPNNGRAFDIVVELKNDKPKNREAAIGLAKQVLAAR
jgi:hypothetical protein